MYERVQFFPFHFHRFFFHQGLRLVRDRSHHQQLAHLYTGVDRLFGPRVKTTRSPVMMVQRPGSRLE